MASPAPRTFTGPPCASLNLYGGARPRRHAAPPVRDCEQLRPHFTQRNRELPALFEPGNDASHSGATRSRAVLDRILASPAEYNHVVEAGRRRVIAHHTWEHRLSRVMDAAKERFALPW